MLGLLGVTIGLARGALGVLVAFIAVVLQVLFCIVLARFVTTSMARLLRSRRGKDLAVFLFIPIFAVFEFLIQVIPRAVVLGESQPGELRRHRQLDALAAARPGRARDPGRLDRAPG